MDLQSEREAIEITPDMIEAGARAVRVYLEDTDLDSRERAETIAECVLRAALVGLRNASDKGAQVLR